MRKLYVFGCMQWHGFVVLLAMVFFPYISNAQQLYIDSFAVFGGNGNCPSGPGQTPCLSPGCAVLLGAGSKIVGGSVGSYRLVKTTGSVNITGNIFSGGTIQLSNSNTVTGRITAANSPVISGTILQAGSGAVLKGNIDVKGNIVVGGGTVSGKVTHPTGTTYSGPVPAGGNITGTPSIPTMPVMPAITTFPAAGTTDITTTKTITPGSYRKIALTGSKTITLSGTGIYVFSSIKNSGSANTFVFDFKNNPAGTFRIYVYDDVDLGKSVAKMVNGGNASRIYSETHGKGKTYFDKTCSWYIANGSTGSDNSKWLGTVWAPYAAIYIGSSTGGCDITGALWSGTQVNIQCGVTVNYAPFQQCSTPNVTAGPDKQLDCSTLSVQLSGNSNTPNVQYSWTTTNGGNILSGASTATPIVSAAGTYILTVTAAGGCTAKDTALVTFVPCILPFYPPPANGKVNDIIGAELNSLAANFGHVADSAKTIFIIRHDSVYIEVVSLAGQTQTLLNLLQTPAYGLTDIINNGPNSLVITGKFPIAHLTKLDSLPASSYIDFVRPLFPPLSNSGIINSQGDSAMQSGFVRGGYNLSGNGIKIGVLSDSYNSILGDPAHTNIVNGDLPGAGNPDNPTPVNVLQEYPFGRASDEGRAMLQIIHDIAPKATLDFRTGFISAGDFAQGVLQLQQDGCNIIVDDVTYINDPFFEDGPISQAINYATSQGVSYFSAAGNYGTASYSGIFNPTTPPNGITGFAHNFGGTFLQNDSLYPGTYTMVMQWQDSIYSIGQTSTGTTVDLDIYLTDSQGKALFGFNRNNVGGDPMEVIPFTVTTPTATNIMIIQANGNKPVRFKYVVFRGNLKINTFNTGNSTIVGHANADSSITVGAVRYTKTPAFGVNPPVLETFSSLGGTTVKNTVRNKPDFTAPDGASTTIDFGSINITGTPFPSFFGTSAAAPHAAAVAALLIEGKKKYTNQTLTPSQVRSLLQSSALPIGGPGFNFLSGYGFIRADSAMKTIASPTPVITKLALQDSSIAPGTQNINIIVSGNYFSPNTIVKFRTTNLPTIIVNSTTAIAQVPAFTGNPPILAFTPPKSISGADGGFSHDTLYLFSPVKKIVTVTADNKSKKYGEKMPAFTATILVDSVPLSNTNFTLHQLGLDSIIYNTPASNLSNAGIYFIRPSMRTLNPADSADAALLESYKYVFTDGLLSIDKMPLLITPRDTTFHYGDKIGGFGFNYTYSDANIAPADKAAFFDTIITTHHANLVDTAIAVVNFSGFNGTITDAQLAQLSFLATGNAISSGKAIFSKSINIDGTTRTDTTNVVDVPAQAIVNFIAEPVSANLVNGKAIFSGIALLSGEATLNGKAIFSKSTAVLNSANTNDSSNEKLAVIVNANDLGSGPSSEISELKAINVVTAITAGANTIVPGAMLSNNFEITYATNHFTVSPAELTIKTKDTSFVYGVTPVYRDTIIGLKYNDILSNVVTGAAAHSLLDANNNPVTGNKIPAGTYKIVPYNLPLAQPSNYTVKYISDGKLTVTKATLQAQCADTSREYGSANPVFRIIYQGFVNGEDASSLSPKPVAGTTATKSSNAGIYPITLSTGSSVNYTIVGKNGKLTITPAPLTVKADDKYIYDNASLPKFTSTITGFKNGDNASSCFTSGPVYTVTPVYTKGHPGVYTITPSGLKLKTPGNYTIMYQTGKLYVNHYGCNITAKLNCVQKLTNDPSGYSYVAKFSYTNNNTTAVYVPLGSNNNIATSGSGNFSGQPPIAFAPGTGVFNIYFTGVKITWQLVTSATSSASASSSSSKCAGSFAAQAMSALTTSPVAGEISAQPDSSALQKNTAAYPNPTTGWVSFSISNTVISEKDVQVIGTLGTLYPVRMHGNASVGKFSLDLSGFAPGVYFVRVRVENNFKVFRIIKL